MCEKEKILKEEILALLELTPICGDMLKMKEFLIETIPTLDTKKLIQLKLCIEAGNKLLKKIKDSEKISSEDLHRPMTI